VHPTTIEQSRVEWSSDDAVRVWKGSPEFKERMAQVLQHVEEFQSVELGLLATVEDGAVAGLPSTVRQSIDA